ncbi:MAG: hypothetical protein ACRENI_08755 [Gemmatimonadaceae bacterium]
MESDNGRPDAAALAELEQLVRNVGEELAAFRHRALRAEQRVRDIEERLTAAGELGGGSWQAAETARENSELRARLELASDRTRKMLRRVRFMRNQHTGRGK